MGEPPSAFLDPWDQGMNLIPKPPGIAATPTLIFIKKWQAISRILSGLIIYLGPRLPLGSNRLPINLGVPPSPDRSGR